MPTWHLAPPSPGSGWPPAVAATRFRDRASADARHGRCGCGPPRYLCGGGPRGWDGVCGHARLERRVALVGRGRGSGPLRPPKAGTTPTSRRRRASGRHACSPRRGRRWPWLVPSLCDGSSTPSSTAAAAPFGNGRLHGRLQGGGGAGGRRATRPGCPPKCILMVAVPLPPPPRHRCPALHDVSTPGFATHGSSPHRLPRAPTPLAHMSPASAPLPGPRVPRRPPRRRAALWGAPLRLHQRRALVGGRTTLAGGTLGGEGDYPPGRSRRVSVAAARGGRGPLACPGATRSHRCSRWRRWRRGTTSRGWTLWGRSGVSARSAWRQAIARRG